MWCRRHGVESVVWTKLIEKEPEARRQEDIECAAILAKHGWNACRGGLFNLRADVNCCPPWIVMAYLRRRSEIDQATAAVSACFESTPPENAVLSS